MARKKITVIGGGQIGGILALLIAQKELGDAVIVDIPKKEGFVKGKALDISQTTPHDGYDCAITGTSNWEEIAGSDVIIVTAGVPRKPGMSREDLLDVNIKIITKVAENVKRYCQDAFNIILTNPLDAMVYAFYKITGFPKNRVVGMAGALDTARFRAFVAMETGLSVQDISATVMGGHGPTMVPLPRLASIGGVPLDHFLSQEKIDAIVDRTRKAGTEIVKLLANGSAYFSPAGSATEMAEAYLKDKKRVLPCAALCEGEYGIDGYFIGVPVIIGAGGVEKVIEIKLTEDEKALLANTLEAVKKTAAETKL
ncbi:malate dehydrogenase [candidate division KSB1 bacterium]|nr:malate dehydrogenase [candidate division KSB1 bacterium]